MDAKLSSFIKEIRLVFRGANIFLFGSRARGNPHEYSDYDLIVISDKFSETDFVDRGGVIRRKTKTPLAADLLCYTPQEFEEIRKESIVIKDAMQYAIAL